MKSKPSPERLKSLFPVSNLVLPSFISLPLNNKRTRPSQVWLIFEPDKILQHTTEALPLSWQFMMVLTIFKTSSGWNWYFWASSIVSCRIKLSEDVRNVSCKVWRCGREAGFLRSINNVNHFPLITDLVTVDPALIRLDYIENIRSIAWWKPERLIEVSPWLMPSLMMI